MNELFSIIKARSIIISRMHLIIDGSLVAQIPAEPRSLASITSSNMYLGRPDNTLRQDLQGKFVLDELYLFERELTTAAIRAIFQEMG